MQELERLNTNYASIIKIDENIKEKKDLEKIVLCDVQNKIYPNLEKTEAILSICIKTFKKYLSKILTEWILKF